jgi:hypothetical protein
MTKVTRNLITMYGAVVALGLGLFSVAVAQERHDAPAPHGGTRVSTSTYVFEVVFSGDGVKLQAFTAGHKPLVSPRLSARATFYNQNSPTVWFSRPLRAASGQTSAALEIQIDLSQVPTQGVKVTFQVAGLPDASEPTATFTVPFSFKGVEEITFATATRGDEKAIKAQKLCAVGHGALDVMGTPLKVTRGGQSIFVCCEDCIKKVKADPDKFFGAEVSPAAGAPSKHIHQGHGR